MKNLKNTGYNIGDKGYSKAMTDADKTSVSLFDNLNWLTTKETAVYLRKSVNAIHTLVSRKYLRPRKFANRLYFKKEELDEMLDSSIKRGF
jgi:hypothetical protein